MILSLAAASSAADAVLSLLDRGALRLYTDAGVLLAELRFGAPAFESAVDGRARARRIAPVTVTLPAASVPGTTPPPARAARYEAVRADGRTVFEGAVGMAGEAADLILSDTLLQQDAELEIERFVYTQPTG
jgi:hypothetical protein